MATPTAKRTSNTDFLPKSDMTLDEIRSRAKALRFASAIMLSPGERKILAMLEDVLELVEPSVGDNS